MKRAFALLLVGPAGWCTYSWTSWSLVRQGRLKSPESLQVRIGWPGLRPLGPSRFPFVDVLLRWNRFPELHTIGSIRRMDLYLQREAPG